MRKILVVFGNDICESPLVKSAVFFKEKLGYEIVPLYIQDTRDNIVPMSGIVVNVNNSFLLDEKKSLEENDLKQLYKKLKLEGINNSLEIKQGFSWEIIKEKMKECDILMFEKGSFFSENTVEILKNQFKPMILVGKRPIRAFRYIGISSDDGVKVNKSCYNFMNLFPDEENFKMFTYNYQIEDNKLLKYLKSKGKKVEVKSYNGEFSKEEYIKEVNKMDILIMGNLSRSYLFSKITGKKGVYIMENTEVSLFIG